MTERGAHEFATRLMGPLSGGEISGFKGTPGIFKISELRLGAGYDRRACCEALGNLGPPRAARRAKAPLGPQAYLHSAATFANVRPVMSPSASPGGSSPVAFT